MVKHHISNAWTNLCLFAKPLPTVDQNRRQRDQNCSSSGQKNQQASPRHLIFSLQLVHDQFQLEDRVFAKLAQNILGRLLAAYSNPKVTAGVRQGHNVQLAVEFCWENGEKMGI